MTTCTVFDMEVFMEKHPVKKENDAVVAQENREISAFPQSFFPFMYFTCSSTLISSDGQTTQIKAEEHRYEKGRLESRRFEGAMACDVFTEFSRIMDQQMNLFLKSFSLFLPFK